MRIEVVERLGAELLDRAWGLYNDAFEELRAAAVQRHLMYRDEFDAVMGDPRVGKYLAYDADGDFAGLATLTNRLEAVPLISPEYFQRRWPERFAERRIFYVGFAAVCPGDRGSGIFAGFVAAMYQVAAAHQGVIALDICRRNEEEFGLPEAVRALFDRLARGTRIHRLDEQVYWLYEFPAST
jgi:hypothetical protein